MTKEQERDYDLYHDPLFRERFEAEKFYQERAKLEKHGDYREPLYFKHNMYLQSLVRLGLL